MGFRQNKVRRAGLKSRVRQNNNQSVYQNQIAYKKSRRARVILNRRSARISQRGLGLQVS